MGYGLGMWLVLTACLHPTPPATGPVSAVAIPAAVPALATISERELRALVAAPGQPTLFAVWASWCGPCRYELPILAAVAAAHPELNLVLVNVDEPEADRLAAGAVASLAIQSVRLEADAGSDLHGALGRSFPEWEGIIPYSVLVTEHGAVVKSFQGAAPPTELETVVRTILSRGLTP